MVGVYVYKLSDGNVRLSFTLPNAKEPNTYYWDLTPAIALNVAKYIRVALGVEPDRPSGRA